MGWKKRDTMTSLRREIVGDSRVTERLVTKLIRLVREDERQKTITDLSKVRDRAEEGR